MLFIAIAQHSPAQCPGSVKEVFSAVSANMAKLPDLAKKHQVKLSGMWVIYGSHKTVVVMDAPSYEAAERLLDEAGLFAWNTVELAQAHPPEEAMKEAAERFGQKR